MSNREGAELLSSLIQTSSQRRRRGSSDDEQVSVTQRVQVMEQTTSVKPGLAGSSLLRSLAVDSQRQAQVEAKVDAAYQQGAAADMAASAALKQTAMAAAMADAALQRGVAADAKAEAAGQTAEKTREWTHEQIRQM
jgi:hypothetical protein